MDRFNSSYYNSIDNLAQMNDSNKLNISISDALGGFAGLRISALKNAAEISPHIKTATIGPNSPAKKELYSGEETLLSIQSPKQPQENLMKDKLREELRYTLKLKGIELQLQETSENLFEGLLESMILKHVDSIGNYYKKQAENWEQNMITIKARKLRMLKTLQSNDNSLLLEEAKLDEHRSQMIDKQTMDDLSRKIEEQNQATARFASVTHSYTKICNCCNEISNILQIEPNGKAIGEKYLSTINTVMTNISLIIDLCKTGTITDKEVTLGEVLSINLENIKNKIIEELDTLKQQNLIREQEEKEALNIKEFEEKQAIEIEDKKKAEIEEIEIVDTQPNVVKPLFYSSKNYSYFEQLKKYLESYEAKYKELLENMNLKKFRFDCQKAVNTPVNAISSVSELHMRDKFDKLSKLLRGERVQVLDSYVTASQHPQGLNYCTALLAKKIVRQGDLLVSSNPEAAFPLAAITVALWTQFPEFGKLLEAYFHRCCPYLVPMFLPQKEGQTDKEFYLSRGYTYNDDGVVEKQDKFLKRMSGIFRLRCAIWISRSPRFINTPNPHNLKCGWRWLASFTNLKPEPDISATLLFDFFTVCGSAFLKHYGKQFIKVIKLINTEYLQILSDIDEGGPKTRLEVLLQNIIKTGHIPPPDGLLKPSIW